MKRLEKNRKNNYMGDLIYPVPARGTGDDTFPSNFNFFRILRKSGFGSGSELSMKNCTWWLWFWKSVFFIFFEKLVKSGLGEVLVQFWIRIRILREKLYILLGSDPFFIDFRKIDFLEIQYFFIFRLSSYISTCFDKTIKCALKKHVQGLIFIIFGWN